MRDRSAGTFEFNIEQELFFSSCLRRSLESGQWLSATLSISHRIWDGNLSRHVTAPLGWSLGGLWALPFPNTLQGRLWLAQGQGMGELTSRPHLSPHTFAQTVTRVPLRRVTRSLDPLVSRSWASRGRDTPGLTVLLASPCIGGGCMGGL